MLDELAAPAGLTTADAVRRAADVGVNAIPEGAPPAWRVFLAKLWGPIPWLLEAAIVLQIGLGEYVEAGVIAALLLFNATLGFVQEGRARAALSALKGRLAPTALVRRDGIWTRRPAVDLVPGDAIRLPLGALVPADAVIRSGLILIDQSMLTGESVPIEAASGASVYAGGIVRRGQAVAEVTATGPRTNFGRAAELVRTARGTSTEQKTILQVTRSLAVINGGVAILILVAAYAMDLTVPDLVRLALTALLASIPVALPATFTLSAAVGAQSLARRGVLLTRLSAVHEAAAIDVLCADKTGTLTRNTLEIDQIETMPAFDRDRVLRLAALASSEGDQDPIDAAFRRAADALPRVPYGERVERFIPFDPDTRRSEAFVVDAGGTTLRIAKGSFEAIAKIAQIPASAEARKDELAADGHRVIAVAVGSPAALELAGLIALADPPRDDSAGLIATLREIGIRTVMVTGDSPTTAGAIAGKIGLAGGVCPVDRVTDPQSLDKFGVFARVLPEQKHQLVSALQSTGHVVGMCGDGVNDAPALRQAQIGIAVAAATDVAKAAAAVVLTEPGLGGIVFAVREGRIAFQRLLAYTFNMLVKKTEIVLFLAVGLAMTGHAVMTPILMVLLLLTNDFLSMSLTTDRASAAGAPNRWRMGSISAAAVLLGVCKLGFSTAVLAVGQFRLGLAPAALQALALVTLVFGNQAVLYGLRERRHLWASRPSPWVLASSAVDIGFISMLAMAGVLMSPLSGYLILSVGAAAVGFALLFDQIKLPVTALFKIA